MSKKAVRADAIRRIEANIRRAKRLQEELDRFWKSLEAIPTLPELDANLHENAAGSRGGLPDFSTMHLTEAVVEVVKSGLAPMTKLEVREELAVCGLDRDARSVGNALYRAGQKGLIYKHGERHWGSSAPLLGSSPKKATSSGRFSGETQKEAVKRILSEATRPLTPRQIADRVVASGHVTKAQNFATSVSAILSRLGKRGEAKRSGEGQWVSASPTPKHTGG